MKIQKYIYIPPGKLPEMPYEIFVTSRVDNELRGSRILKEAQEGRYRFFKIQHVIQYSPSAEQKLMANYKNLMEAFNTYYQTVTDLLKS